MIETGVPFYVIFCTILMSLPVAVLIVLFVVEWTRPKPTRSVPLGDDKTLELWVRVNKQPVLADAIVVPVAPDLKMAVGMAKWVRDKTANTIQYQALDAAPLPPGEAFVGSGGKYRFNVTALAVVMDDLKRTSPAWIASGIRHAIERARAEDAQSILVPDMTEDLLRQPQWITDEQRRETCRPIARAIFDGILSADADMSVVKVWVWRAGYEDIFIEEMERIAQSHAAPTAHAAHA